MDDCFVEHADDSGCYSCLDKGTGDESPFPAGFPDVLVHGRPITVVLGQHPAQVLKGLDTFKVASVDLDGDFPCSPGPFSFVTLDFPSCSFPTEGGVNVLPV